ncbi:DUF4347 domain-containing protein [Microbulbifer pacificus]|uniref:DUF4347 domain-containing protein n=1 Tax=Microbulbifer pacificus TaxID=407164 RepID=UPI000CF4612A|nr:DUF4347 domain-containing protein [Microbulbifer pacificus]
MELNEFSRSSLAQAINPRGRQIGSLHRTLEKRVLLDASVAADVSQSVIDTADDTATAPAHQDSEKHASDHSEKNITEAIAPELAQRQELVVIDLQLNHAQQLVDDLLQQASHVEQREDSLHLTIGERSITLLALDIDDGLNTVTGFIQQSAQTFDAVHLISHGDAGGITLGGEELSLTSLSEGGDDSHTTQLRLWASLLSGNADILLYGCNTGYSLTGEKFINQIAGLTGADVAASDDATGSALRGGDWELEISQGEVETDIVFSQLLQGTWEGLMVATPNVTTDIPGQDFINETTDMTFTFENDGDTTGYGPFMDIVVGPGLEVQSTSGSLGASVETYTVENGQWVDSNGNPVLYHPYDFSQTGAIPLPPAGVEGSTWYAVQLPFGSFTPDQPAYEFTATVLIDEASGAMVGVPIPIYVRPGFAYGNDPLNNPGIDPPIVANPIETSITPTVMLVDKEALDGDGDNASIGDDGETVTGPSEPVTWRVTVDIANMSTIEDLVITEEVPNNFYYVPGNVTVTDSNGNPLSFSVTEPPEGANNNAQLIIQLDNPVTGTLADNDVVISYTGYVPDVDANGNPIVINDGANDAVINTATATGTYQGNSVSDSDDDTIVASATALQKDVVVIQDNGAAGTTPGDRLQYTLTLQISDYIQLQDLMLTDLVGDGIEVDPASFNIEIIYNGTTYGPGSLAASNITVTENPSPGDGHTDVSVNISQELIDLGISADGSLNGDLFADGSVDGTTTIIVTYEATIRENYIGAPYAGTPNESVDALDVISNEATINAILSSANGESVDNSSSESITIEGADFSKNVFAVNDSTDPEGLDEIRVGDRVTFAIDIDLGTLDSQGLVITDYLPLPVFEASTPSYVPTNQGMNIPGINQWGFGPDTDFDNWPPEYLTNISVSVTSDPDNNSITWSFVPVSQVDSEGGRVQLLFTVLVQDKPFTDGLQLTNVATVEVDGTSSSTVLPPDGTQIQVLSPNIQVTKGVVSTDNSNGVFEPDPSAPVTFDSAGTPPTGSAPWSGGDITSADLDTTPIDSNLSGIDAGDTVRFAIVVENSGGSDAFNVAIGDTLPNGFVIPPGGLNLQVYTGNGTAISYTGDLFAGGITLDDPSADEGALNEGRDPDTGATTDGSNIIIITYDLVATDDVQPNQEIINTATLEAYGGVDGGNDYTEGNSSPYWQDDAQVDIQSNSISKELTSTSINTANNSNTQAVIGETAIYTLTLDIAEGVTPSASILDTLDTGLQYINIISAVASSTDIQNAAGNPWTQADLFQSVEGQRVTFDLGSLTNANRDNSVTETITITYEVLVQNTLSNQSGDQLNNNAQFFWDSTDDNIVNPTAQDSASAENIEVIEPDLQIEKSLLNPGTSVDANDVVTYVIEISHSAFSDTDAFDITFTDTLPPELNSATIISVTHPSDPNIATKFQVVGDTIQTVPGQTFDLVMGETLVLQISGIVDEFIVPGSTITNTATAEWTSIDGDDPNERTGVDGPGGLNDYRTSGSETLTTTSILGQGKQVVSSSEENSYNGLTQAVIGETVTYASYFIIPEGSVPLAIITDTLPPGLEFVSLDEVIVGSNISSTIDLSNPANLNPPPSGTTGEITFTLGNITNGPGSTLPEDNTVALIYTVKVQNIASNQANTVLTNTATFSWDSNGNGMNDAGDAEVSQQADITILEPELVIDKVADVTTGDNGDQISYTITVTNPNNGSSTIAYDISFNDPLPAELTNITISASVDYGSGPSDISGDFAIVNGEIVLSPQAELDLEPGAVVTITVTGTLVNTIVGSTITNTASVNWTSLDGANPDERTGADGEGGALNDYAANDDAEITVNSPTITKQLVSTSQNDDFNDDSEATIGEIVTFSVTVMLPEATITGQIFDVYGEGFEFVDLISVTTSDPDALQIDFDQVTVIDDPANYTIGLDFGTLVNTSTDNVEESVTFVYRLRVTDVSSNTQGTVLNNDATLFYDTDGDLIPDTSIEDNAQVSIVEPVLDIEKTLLSPSPLTLGGIATYQITVQLDPSSGADAYNVTIEDLLPTYLGDYENIQIDVQGGAPTIDNNTAANFLSIDISAIDSSTVVTITFDTRVTSDPAAIGQDTTNTVDIEYTSLDTPDGGDDSDIEREYTGSDDETASIAAFDLFVVKDDGGITVAPGDTITYTIEYGNNGTIDATNVVITESLPDYVTFDPALNPGWTLNGDTLTYNVGTVAAGGTGSVTLTVTVINPIPSGVEETTNTVSIDTTDGSDPNPDDNSDNDNTPIDAAPDYVAVKTNEFTSPVQPGDPVSWTIEISNQGNQDGTGVVVTDTLPDTSLFTNFTASNGGVIDLTAGTVTWDIGNLAAGDSVTLTLSAVVVDAVPVTIPTQTNTVTVNDDGNNGPDPTPDNNTDNTEFDITYVDLAIDKNDGDVTAEPGDTVVYTLNYANNGTADATGVVITESLPDYASFDAASSTPGWVDNGDGTFSFTVGTLAAGETGSVEFAVTIIDPLPAGVVETSNLTSIEDDGGNGPDQNPDDNSDNDNTPIDAAPDYVAVKTNEFTSPVQPGDPVSWTIEISNQGNQDGTGVVVTDTLPDTSLFTNFTASNGGVIDLTAGTVTWDIGNLAAGDSVTLTLSAVVVDAVPVTIPTQTNTVTVNDDGNNGPDPTPDNNTDNTEFDITYVDLAIDKNDGGVTAEPGDTVVYTLNYANNGTADATGVVITESLPDYASFDAASSTPGWVDNGDGTFSFTVGTLAAGETGSVEFAITIDNSIPAGVVETSNLTSIEDDGGNGPDQNPDDNSDNDNTPIDAAPDYVIDKIENFDDPAHPGAPISWTIKVSNQGNQNGTGVIVVDILPDTSLFTGFSASDGGIIDLEAGTVTWDIGSLPAGETVALTLSATIVDNVPVEVAPQTNSVTVHDDGNNGPDPTPDNNTDTETFTIEFVDLYIDKDDSGVEPRPTESIVYTLEYGNRGNATSTGVLITETLPPNTSFDAANSSPVWVQNGDVFTYDVGSLAPGESGSITFAVTVNYPISASVQQTNNTASITDDGTHGPDKNPKDNTDTDETDIENDIAVDNITLSQLYPEYIYPPREWERQAPQLHGRLIAKETENVTANLQGGRNGAYFDPAFGPVDGNRYPNDWSTVFRNDLSIDVSPSGQGEKSSPLALDENIGRYRANSLFGDFERPAASPNLPAGATDSGPVPEPLPAPLQSSPLQSGEPISLPMERSQLQQQLDEIALELSEAHVSPLLAALAALSAEEPERRQHQGTED